MKFLDRPELRQEQILETARLCASDRDERKAYHADLRSLYTLGTTDGTKAPYNKLQSHCRQSAAYLFQSESVRLAPRFTTTRYGDTFVNQLDAYRDEVHAWWHDSKAGLPVSIGVEWGHVYPTVIWKVVPSAGEPRIALVPDPADVGVLEPDRDFDHQEAKIHFFWLTLDKFRRLISGHPRETELLKIAIANAETGEMDTGPGGASTVERIAFDTVGAPLEGGGVPVTGVAAPRGHVETPRVLMAELWVVDDRIHDWRIAWCLAAGGEVHAVIFDRRTTILAGVDPFVRLTLHPMPDYAWGMSQVDDLGGLQEEYVGFKSQVRRFMDLGLDPPIVLFGVGNLKDDRAERIRTPRGVLTVANPNGKVERISPTLPPETFTYQNTIDREFADAGGLPLLFSGQQGDQTLRAGNQVGALATLASARIRENAMRVEYAVSELATLGALLLREMHTEPLQTASGEKFLLKQLPREIVFTVASHSASPLYAMAVGDKADRALKAGAISRPSYIDLLDLPMPDQLRAEARRLEKAAAERAERVLKIQEERARHGKSR